MAEKKLRATPEENIRVLLVDDSIVFRRFMQETIKGLDSVSVCGIAKNGIEALDLVLKLRPSVILMDLEMPLMDGITALQHLMIHKPTPTVIVSNYADEGSREEAAAMKNGAVGFISKYDFFETSRQDAFAARIGLAIIEAAKNKVQSIRRNSETIENIVKKENRKQLVFCEECGARTAVDISTELQKDALPLCGECGDPLIVLEGLKSRAE